MGNLLLSAYDAAKPTKKLPFNVNAVMDALLGEPLNIDIGRIIHTPQTVILKKTDDDTDGVVKAIRKRFSVSVLYRSDLVIFKEK